MNLKEIREITIGKLKNAKWRREVFNDAKKLKISHNQQMLNEAELDVEYYDRIFKILNKISKWYELLQIDGGNTKHQVVVDIEKLIKEDAK